MGGAEEGMGGEECSGGGGCDDEACLWFGFLYVCGAFWGGDEEVGGGLMMPELGFCLCICVEGAVAVEVVAVEI